MNHTTEEFGRYDCSTLFLCIKFDAPEILAEILKHPDIDCLSSSSSVKPITRASRYGRTEVFKVFYDDERTKKALYEIVSFLSFLQSQ